MLSTQFYLSAAHKSSGKTMVSLGLCDAFSKRKLKVQSFKKGLDYIDPIWLALASKNPCYNLDFYTMTKKEIQQTYHQYSQDASVSLIEGNKGLFDGLNTLGGDSNADLANLLDLPVVLVVDATGITRGIAPLLQGYINFDNTRIAGVIINKVATKRHEAKLIQAIEHYTDLSVFGSIYRDNKLFVEERHLGLKPANEDSRALENIDKIGNRIEAEVDIVSLLGLKQENPSNNTPTIKPKKTVKIAIAKDQSFGFYYADDLQALQDNGAEIVYFDAINDLALPKADGLFIGGGFPEVYAQALSNNKTLLADIKQKIQTGLPTYAECGGLMYLTRSINTDLGDFPMVGIIPADTVMQKKPVGRGYVQLVPNQHPWLKSTSQINAHEFHYSKLINLDDKMNYAYTVNRGMGIYKQKDGIILHNLLASYAHIKNTKQSGWVEDFLNFVSTHKNRQTQK